ncbi:FMN-dependent oxidoreductase, nitrilotriacetate monooxygenase family [Frankia torreyi]|uniref:FMN-dependent oxidoreductase, nitrilotriacetate monooxygenase family n=2 Tax=Frankia TaxID=1854 RepID=A0A0D8BGP3_9ACTN|nr:MULTISPECIES: NtaA/DmoA family FMN-dependent monooxygenase [Frankia]KJE23443.1 FMN-dependent oxidoreductase, nitrilotriacetate monooxygenase family [Frankia torreyi]KQM05555.1 FMN-dependent oxidoreductase, nitrilotriacetate monooxygenase family [Frankia sp. CpI1-P]
MPVRTLKLGAVLIGVGGPGQHNTWLNPEIPGDASVDVRWYIARAQEAEAARFDHVFIVDSQFITADSPNHYLSRLEPLTLLSAIAVHTHHIGLVGTITTSYNEPFNVARRLASLDHISGGRAGWNVVTSGDSGTAGNYSRDEHFDYPTRYGRAIEHVRVAQGLWDSYEADAFPRDKERGVFFDRSRQHALNHAGEYFSVVGPLNLERTPQGQPVIFQAGDSEEGRDLGATIADAIFTHSQTLEQAQAFRTELRARAAAKGRDPENLLIVPGISPIIADTDEQARAKEDAILGEGSFDRALAELGRPFGWHDFSQYDLDAPFPEVGDVAERSFRTHAEAITKLARDNSLTLRQVVEHQLRARRSPFVGSPLTVANEIERWFTAGGFDGVNITVNAPSEFARFTDQVLPILRERGVVRSEYESTTLRGNLGLPIPENRYTAARRQAQSAGDAQSAGEVEVAGEVEADSAPPALVS